MVKTWDEIIEQVLAAKERGHPFQIPLEELEAAVPDRFAKMRVSDPTLIGALNIALEPHGLRAEFNKAGRFVTVGSR